MRIFKPKRETIVESLWISKFEEGKQLITNNINSVSMSVLAFVMGYICGKGI